MKASALVVALAFTSAAAQAAIVSDDAVRRAEGAYKAKYGVSEMALNCAGFAHVGPTRPASRNAVPGQDYKVEPHPAVKWAAEVDMQPRAHGDGGALCNYINKPDVKKWYSDNFHIQSVR
ncbi:MAG: hypothetical protein M3Z31_16060 [Pseudomonadota bacterium]|nr:hypothetical protein [Pseudomonadota bacterium]